MRHFARVFYCLTLASVFLFANQVSLAKDKTKGDLEEGDRLPSVQNRLYRCEHELNAGVGILPVDAYYKGVAFTGGYTWHISDIWAAEGQFAWIKNLNTSLRDKLENNFGIPTTRFMQPLYYATAGALFKPIYGKLSLLNKSLVYGELYLSLAGVVGRVVGSEKTEDYPEGRPARMAFGGAPGFGIRGYFTPHFSARFDFRWLMLFSEGGDAHFPLALTLTLAATTRSDL